MCASLSVCSVKGAVCAGLGVVVGEYAVAACHDAGYEFARGVGVDYALALYDVAGLWCEFVPHCFHGLFHWCYLVGLDWCSGVAFYAADAATGVEVAAEVLGEEVEAYECVLDFEHWGGCGGYGGYGG